MIAKRKVNAWDGVKSHVFHYGASAEPIADVVVFSPETVEVFDIDVGVSA